ncbi:hypothetical protein NQ318_019390 [Aromia moschata]|uniref:Mos1 transposase HTH domain-containing protein n=1 Tax=Aromia moschata TaxID=1265417 RepID=A0AAV8XEJ0_9CUCU|nr:hypothetical protein NQ318_019390 [Aromia moschata]
MVLTMKKTILKRVLLTEPETGSDDRLSEKQRIEILIIREYGDMQRSQDQVCALFNELYPNRSPINQSKNSAKSGRPSTATGGDKALDIFLLQAADVPKERQASKVRENSIQSSRVLATPFDVSHQSVKNVFKRKKLYPYKVELVH